MISMRISQSDNKVYIDVSGYITSKDAKDFLAKYKQNIKSLRTSQYTLVVEPTKFKCENEKDVKNVCMNVFKSGFKRVYMVDPENHIISTLKLGSLEKKIFSKAVNFVETKSHIQ